jgi:lipopolysaccharide transport system ATP-binding protein
MYVRLAFATALHFDPEVLVVDEVLAVGDARFQRKCMDRLVAFRAQGGTLLLASHANDQIRALCDEVLVLEEGSVVQHSEPDSALQCYTKLMAERTERRAAEIDIQERAVTPAVGYREGTQEATLTSVRLLDGERDTSTNGDKVRGLPTGNDLVVELAYRLQKPVKDMAVVVTIWQGNETKCVDTVVPSIVKWFGSLPPVGMLRCRVPELRLLPGDYSLSVGLYPPDFEFTYDYHWQMPSSDRLLARPGGATSVGRAHGHSELVHRGVILSAGGGPGPRHDRSQPAPRGHRPRAARRAQRLLPGHDRLVPDGDGSGARSPPPPPRRSCCAISTSATRTCSRRGTPRC